MSINIVLSNDQDGYSAIREHIIEYWGTNGYATAVVRLATSSDGREYREDNEIVSPYWGNDGDVTIEHLHDWWEGEKYIKILGIKNLFEIDICADVVEVVRCKDCKFNVANMEKDPNCANDYSGADIVCSYFMTDGLEPNDFCSRGERSENGK